MSKWLLNGYEIKTGTKDMWFIHDDLTGHVEVKFSHVRLKQKKCRELKRCVFNGVQMNFKFIDEKSTLSFAAMPTSIKLSGKKKFIFTIRSTGEITSNEQTNAKD